MHEKVFSKNKLMITRAAGTSAATCQFDRYLSLQALDHMHANEVILTFGHSNTAQLFLKEAAKKRNFQVCPASIHLDAYLALSLLSGKVKHWRLSSHS